MALRIVALAGGGGGAKLADGLARALPPGALTVIVNTGDDFTHFGLRICPDLDTVCYTLAGLDNPETGWGLAGESWSAIGAAARLGGPDWFRLGDHDLGTHLERTRRLGLGQPLSAITRDLCQAWKIETRVLPMCDQPVATMVDTAEHGELAFQEYFVRERCAPRVRGFRFAGIEQAIPAPGALQAIAAADAVVFCPSNPWVSIDPILSVAGMRAALQGKRVLAVSPILGGQTVKGPAAKMYTELGIQPSALAVARHYTGLLTDFVLDRIDHPLADQISGLGMRAHTLDTLMSTPQERLRLAQDVLHLIGTSS